jgi:hypothetical protein
MNQRMGEASRVLRSALEGENPKNLALCLPLSVFSDLPNHEYTTLKERGGCGNQMTC